MHSARAAAYLKWSEGKRKSIGASEVTCHEFKGRETWRGSNTNLQPLVDHGVYSVWYIGGQVSIVVLTTKPTNLQGGPYPGEPVLGLL